MRIKFTASTNFGEYHGCHEGVPLDFEAGQERDVPDEKARQLIATFPLNFCRVEDPPVSCEIEAAPVDRMMKKEKVRRK